jgi:hypothetical protein
MEEITLREVEWHPKTNRICQIPKEGLEFAMLSNGYEQLNQLVWCKDFMQDLIWSYVNNQVIDIYGFHYDPKFAASPSLRRLKLLVTNYKDAEFGHKVKNNVLPLLHSVENRLKMSKTILEKCKTTPATYKKAGVWILDSSKRWLKSPPMLSFYTLLVRIGLVHNPKDTLEQTLEKIQTGKLQSYYDTHNRDKEMISKALPGIKDILKYSDRKIFPSKIQLNYPSKYVDGTSSTCFSKMTIYNIHDRCGLVGFSSGTTRQYFPNWHKYR